MQLTILDIATEFVRYASDGLHQPLFVCGDSLHVLQQIPSEID